MARARIVRSSAPIVLASPGRARIARAASVGARAAARAAMTERHTLAAVAAAAVAGYIARPGGPELPHVEALGLPGTYGLAAWILGRTTRSNVAQHVATGLLAAAVYDFAKRD